MIKSIMWTLQRASYWILKPGRSIARTALYIVLPLAIGVGLRAFMT